MKNERSADCKSRHRTGRGTKSPLRIIAELVIAAALITSGVIFLPRLVHHCDNCGSLFFGTGYYANTVSNALSSLRGKENKILCRGCAESNHSIEIALGESLDDFKRPLFETEGE